jgi:hypothetical protein
VKISRLGHFLRVVIAGGVGVAAESLSSSPYVHGAWAPAVLLGLRWVADELRGATSVGG